MGEYTRVEEGTPNLFGLHEYDDRTSFFDEGTFALPQVAGWGELSVATRSATLSTDPRA